MSYIDHTPTMSVVSYIDVCPPLSVAEAVHTVNTALEGDSPAHLLEQLQNHYGGLESVQEHEASQYLSVMKTLRAAKAEVGGHYLE